MPVDIPRFWINSDESKSLFNILNESTPKVQVSAKMDWELVNGHNIIAVLPGEDTEMPRARDSSYRNGETKLSSCMHYDAMSIVPALAPGAESASGVAALLESVRLLKKHGHTRYTIIFLASSGHFEGLSGINDFLYKHSRNSDYFKNRINPDELIDFRLFIGLDLHSHSNNLAGFTMGIFIIQIGVIMIT